ncbi:MAG TPA: sugar transferase [Lachnospiraceae bacterium]|nr:sugar transferase [Lachnospiraceae bacterium]
MIYQRFVKRIFDIIISGIAIVLLSPIYLVMAILVASKLGRPVLFRQKRPGKNEQIFDMYKFRSMTNETDEAGDLLPDEARLNSFGKKLRSTSLDELPELLNIFKGDMSIVGPRPLLIKYLPYYTEEEKLRHSVRPGLTGLAQVNGRNSLNWEERFSYDIQYVKQCSFVMDVKIIWMTIGKVLKREDTLSGSEQTVEDFDVYRSR